MATKKYQGKSLWVASLPSFGVIATLLLILWILVSDKPVAGNRATCMNNQKNVALALLNYQSSKGHFPPAYVTGEEGKPLYSWRVLLLPYLENIDIYEKLHLNEPWDSPHNKKLLSEIRYDFVFRCSRHPKGEESTLNHVLVTGPGTICENGKVCSMEGISCPSQTLMLIEVADTGTHWAKPFDLDIENIDPRFLDKQGNFKTNHHNAAIATFADGHTTVLYQEEILPALKELSQIKQRPKENFEY